MTGDAACRGIRDHDPDGSIGLIGEEPRSALQPAAALEGALAGRRTRRRSGAARPTSASSCSRPARSSRSTGALGRSPTTRARRYGYERLLLATGGTAAAASGRLGRRRRLLPPTRRLPAAARARRRGTRRSSCSAAASSAPSSRPRSTRHGCAVTLVFPEDGIGARLFPADLAESVNELYRGQASRCCPASSWRRSSGEATRFTVRLESGRDARGGRRGRRPRDRARDRSSPRRRASRSTTASSSTSTAAPATRGDVFAAGDVARFPAPALGTDIRVEHEDQANSHGRAVGANMAGAGRALRPPAVLLLRPLRARLRGRRRGRLPQADGRRVERAVPEGRRRLPRRAAAARAASCSSTRGARSTPRPS